MSYNALLSWPGASQTLYAIVRRVSDGKARDTGTSAWDTYAEADRDDYDTPLTDLDGDVHAFTWPTGIGTSTPCLVHIYQQAGAAPADGDYLIGSYTDTPGSGRIHTILTRVNTLVGNTTVTDSAITATEADVDTYRGDTYPISFDCGIDLTSGTLAFTVKRTTTAAQADALITKASTDATQLEVTDATAGQFDVKLLAADTSALCDAGKIEQLVYDVQLTDADGYIRTIARGAFRVHPDVTTS